MTTRTTWRSRSVSPPCSREQAERLVTHRLGGRHRPRAESRAPPDASRTEEVIALPSSLAARQGVVHPGCRVALNSWSGCGQVGVDKTDSSVEELFSTDEFASEDWERRYTAYRRVLDEHPDALDIVLARVAKDTEVCLADSIRRDVIINSRSPSERAALAARKDFSSPEARADLVDMATSHDEIEQLAGEPELQPPFLRKRVADAHALLDVADNATPVDRLVAIAESTSARAQRALLRRGQLPAAVVESLVARGATRAIRNAAANWSPRKTT